MLILFSFFWAEDKQAESRGRCSQKQTHAQLEISYRHEDTTILGARALTHRHAQFGNQIGRTIRVWHPIPRASHINNARRR